MIPALVILALMFGAACMVVALARVEDDTRYVESLRREMVRAERRKP